MTLLDMENKESILSALTNLEIEANRAPSPILEEYLREVAKHGLTLYGVLFLLYSIPWFHIKPLILQKFNHIMDEFIEDTDEGGRRSIPRNAELNDLRERVYKVLNQFEGKIYNVDPRLCSSIERSSTTLNGTSAECGSNSSVEDSSSGTKRSDEEEDDVDDDNAVSTQSVSPPRRPCINFYRSLSERHPPSNLSEVLQKPSKEILIGSYSPGIPGKHTLQRPFLSSRTSSSFRPILEESEDSISDVVQEREEKRVDDMGLEDTSIEEGEIRIRVASDSRVSQGSRSLTGMQKIFLESESEEAVKPTTPTVPPIDQMLRPMGQLEAFVNTISMATSTPSPVDVAASTTIVTSTVSTSSNPDGSSECCTPKNAEDGLKGLEPPEHTMRTANTGANAGCKEETVTPSKSVEGAEGGIGFVISRPSLKRETSTFGESNAKVLLDRRSPDLMPSPAKRVRVGNRDGGDVDQDKLVNISIEPSLMEEERKEEVKDAPVIEESPDEVQHSSHSADEPAPKQEAAPVQVQASEESSAVIDSETGEHETV
ncbi:unnamed protein product [Hydatigera taeniaeformis]|uniref:Serine/arginine repetitive matrix protein 2 n=1 Tax=Hydatigena taeniaeformis TaxID=6205 RepID=A0A0R3X637_HYDTA|nr:unnamed protein product [Hydatigera taeniaeformis]